MLNSHDHAHLDHPPQSIYFIGIALPPDLDKIIGALKWQLHDGNKHTLKPVIPHVTLLNPPSLQGILPSQLVPRIHEVVARYLPITITLTNIGFFGPRVCYIEAESFSLHSMQPQLVRLLPPEAQAIHYKRPFLPHVTLVQTYEPATLSQTAIVDQINTVLSLPLTFTVDSVSHFTRIKPRVYESMIIDKT